MQHTIMSTPSLQAGLNPSFSNNLTVPKQREHTAADKHRRTLSSIDTQGESRESSTGVWAEDYYTFDFGFGGGPDKAEKAEAAEVFVAEPPPAFFSSRQNSSCEEEEELPQATSQTQRSFASLLPSFRSYPKSPKHGHIKDKHSREIEEDFMPILTGDEAGFVNVTDKSRGGLASSFTGSSAPVAVGVPTMEDDIASVSNSSHSENITTQPSRQPNTTPSKPALLPSTSRFNFFSSPKTPNSQTNTIQLPADLNTDASLTLDIDHALFPGGRNSEDPFSPAAFKNLLMNAEGLLLKLQTAYKVRTIALHQISTEKETIDEELDEVRTRVQCFKVQIEDLAHQNSSKDERIKALERELMAERKVRAEEREARERSITIVRENANRDRKRTSASELSINTQLAGEDLEISSAASIDRRKWRSSTNSIDTSTMDDDSDTGESVFSRSRSPALTINSSANISLAGTEQSTPEILQASFARVLSPSTSHPHPLRPKAVQQRSTFQKILTTISASPELSPEKDAYDGMGLGQEGCSNCRGKSASVAWDTVGLMRAENKGLKERVGELESASESALDYIYGLGITRGLD